MEYANLSMNGSGFYEDIFISYRKLLNNLARKIELIGGNKPLEDIDRRVLNIIRSESTVDFTSHIIFITQKSLETIKNQVKKENVRERIKEIKRKKEKKS